MSMCEYRWLRAAWYALPANQRHLWLRENAGHLRACSGDEA